MKTNPLAARRPASNPATAADLGRLAGEEGEKIKEREANRKQRAVAGDMWPRGMSLTECMMLMPRCSVSR
jgi:hypothetical protein